MSRPHLNPLLPREEAGCAPGAGLNQLFASLDVYHDINSRSAAMNMAIDEALLENVVAPTIRFYRWNHPALSFGYFGKFEDAARYQRDIVRRWTGGGIVFHGEDLTYSVVIPTGDAAFTESSTSIYEKVHLAIRDALTANAAPAELAAAGVLSERRSTLTSAASDRGYNNCFANPVRADVLLNGRKVAGAAQRRTRRGLLQQGSIQHIDLGNGFADQFAENLCYKCRPKEVTGLVVARAREIAKEKYDTAEWLNQR